MSKKNGFFALVLSLFMNLLVLRGAVYQGQSHPLASSEDRVEGMALIPPGEFWMGREWLTLNDEFGILSRDRLDDRPVHLVHVDSYYIDKHEVTNAEYARFVEATKHRHPYHWIGGKVPEKEILYPIYNVSWDDAVAYCGWAGKRLPTEAEWERSARGLENFKLYPWGNDLGQPTEVSSEEKKIEGGQQHARFNMPDGPIDVASLQPNDFGLYDTIGNVAEWVSDWYHRNYYSVSPERNPQGPKTGSYKVLRGGTWADEREEQLHVHYRNFTAPSMRTPTIGFRCAKDGR